MGHAFSKREAKERAALFLQRYSEGVTARELADHLGCHISTAYRYLEDFQNEGIYCFPRDLWYV